MANQQRIENDEEVEIIELNLRHITIRDARMVSNFIASHGAELTLPFIKSTAVRGWTYTTLADLIILLKHHSILDILDNRRSLIISLLEDLRQPIRFGGSWLDSLEILIVDNAKNDSRHLKKLRNVEKQLKRCDDEIMRKWRRNGNVLMRFMRKLVKSKLAVVMEEKKAVSHARKSLNFFYPI